MAKANDGDTVKVHYTGRLDDGTVFDTSREGRPLRFTLGEGQLIPGFEEAVFDMEPGQSKEVHIAPEMAYGPVFEEMIQTIERRYLPQDLELEVGRQLQLQQPDGEPLVLTITDVQDETITVDGNHPLAGRELIFAIELMEINPEDDEEEDEDEDDEDEDWDDEDDEDEDDDDDDEEAEDDEEDDEDEEKS